MSVQGTLEQREGVRRKVFILAAEGWSNVIIARKLKLHRNGIAKMRGHFAEHGLDCLKDARRSGQPLIHQPPTKQKIVATV